MPTGIYERPQLSERLARGTQKTAGCWLWTRAHTPFGHGMIYVAGRRELAHRVAWELANGKIPDGQRVLHRCDQPRCVRPDHLFLGSMAENTRDMISKTRQNFWGNAKRLKLTDEQVAAARSRVAAGESQGAVAKSFGVHQSHISRIVSGDSRRIAWRNS